MNENRRTFLRKVGTGTVIGASSMLAGCSGGDEETDTSGEGGEASDTDDSQMAGNEGSSDGLNRGGTIRIAQARGVHEQDGIVPHTAGGQAAREIMMNLGNRLTRINAETGEVEPDLATDWEFADDGMSITFQLREGVQFHPPYEREMVAEDIVENYEQILDPEYGSPSIAQFEGTMVDDSTDPSELLEATGEYEVTFHFITPFANVLEAVANDRLAIIPMESLDELGEDLGQPGGDVSATGPYMFESTEPGQEHRFVKNPNYFRDGEDGDPLPYADELVYRVIPESGAQRSAMVAGDLDLTGGVSGGAFSEFQNAEGVVAESTSGLRLNVIWMNTWHYEPVRDTNVRRAFQFAVNNEAMNEVAFNGLGEAAQTIFPSTIEREDLSWEEVIADTTDFGVGEVRADEAQAAIAESENPDFEEFTLHTDQTNRHVQMGSVAEQNLREAGFDPTVETVPSSSGWSIWQGQWDDNGPPEDQPMIVQDFGRRSTHPNDLINFFYRTGNFANLSYWEDEEFMEMSDESLETSDPDRRAELYHDMAVHVTEEAPAPALAFSPVMMAWREEIQNFGVDPLQSMYLDDVWISS